MAHRMLQDPDADGWERGDFPIVCETCLGPNPYVRMQRIEFGGTCHISGRPYTVFRWRPGNDARYKKTIICQEIAKAKNVCQVCLFDLDYGLPVQVRDTALGIEKEDIPESDVGKEFQLNEQIQRGETESSFGGGTAAASDMLMQLQRTTPYYKRNQSRICSFFVKGQCTRGAECPYRHEMPVQNELSEQNIKDRYYGINDPVANKMMRRYTEQPKLELPDDRTITSLYIGGVTTEITEDDIRDVFYTYGEISSVRKVASRFCAFVTFTERSAAEKAAEALHGKLIIKGIRLRLMWGRPQQKQGQQQHEHDPMQPIASNKAAAGAAGDGAASSGADHFGLAPAAAGGPAQYPSMDPTAMGARIPLPKRGGEADDSEAAKRQRMVGSNSSGTGYGAAGYAVGGQPAMPPLMPPMGMPPMGMMQPPMQPLVRPGMVMQPPGMMPVVMPLGPPMPMGQQMPGMPSMRPPMMVHGGGVPPPRPPPGSAPALGQ